MKPTDADQAPLWQAWVEAGETEEEQEQRLTAVPERHWTRVSLHLRTVQALARFHSRKRP